MKTKFLSILSMMMMLFIQQLIAQGTVQKDTITILGNCGECKERIEEAAYIKGVKEAVWNKTSKVLSVVYNTKKTSLDKICASIAKAGHDSPVKKAGDKEYGKLPSCCAYRTNKCENDD
jgi:hypothetical protein